MPDKCKECKGLGHFTTGYANYDCKSCNGTGFGAEIRAAGRGILIDALHKQAESARAALAPVLSFAYDTYTMSPDPLQANPMAAAILAAAQALGVQDGE